MPLTNPAYQCRGCREFYMSHEIFGNNKKRRGWCGFCLVKIMRKLEEELRILKHAKANKSRRVKRTVWDPI